MESECSILNLTEPLKGNKPMDIFEKYKTSNLPIWILVIFCPKSFTTNACENSWIATHPVAIHELLLIPSSFFPNFD